MAWKCPLCSFENNDSVIRCICGYEEEKASPMKDMTINNKKLVHRIGWVLPLIAIAVLYAGFLIHTVVEHKRIRQEKGRWFAGVALHQDMTLGEVKRLLREDPKVDISAKANLRGVTFWHGLVKMYFYAPPDGVNDMSVAVGWEIADEFQGTFAGIRPRQTTISDEQYTREFGNWRIRCRRDGEGKAIHLDAWDTRLRWKKVR